jgi:hypothetical protein
VLKFKTTDKGSLNHLHQLKKNSEQHFWNCSYYCISKESGIETTSGRLEQWNAETLLIMFPIFGLSNKTTS